MLETGCLIWWLQYAAVQLAIYSLHSLKTRYTQSEMQTLILQLQYSPENEMQAVCQSLKELNL